MKPVQEMTDQEKDQVRSWIRRWEELGPILERLRAESIRQADTAAAIEAFGLAYKSARLHGRRRTSSGLVEQQRWFQRSRR
ncbi:MAG TPA: hypothetical protein VJA21_25415 [Verrucomicrobiae bacterium]